MKKLFSILLTLSFFAAMPRTCRAACIRHGDESTPRIALTFDDGPHPYQTDKILALLEKYNIKATFFVVGENVSYYADVLRREVAAGHEIGNHTYHHTVLAGCTEDTIHEELYTTAAIIEEVTGQKPTLFRPPEGNVECIEKADAEGYTVVLWSVDTRDWAKTPAREIVENVKMHVKNGSILLFHDYVSKDAHTYEALETLLPALIDMGYEFVTVSELLGE